MKNTIGAITIAAPKARRMPSDQSNIQIVSGDNRHAVPRYIIKNSLRMCRLQMLRPMGAAERFRSLERGVEKWWGMDNRDCA